MRSSGASHDDCLRPFGTIIQPLPTGIYEALLPNGKTVMAHLSRKLAEHPPELRKGMIVLLEISPFDLDTARIARVVDEISTEV
jgi:translation initiation factor IF-1